MPPNANANCPPRFCHVSKFDIFLARTRTKIMLRMHQNVISSEEVILGEGA